MDLENASIDSIIKVSSKISKYRLADSRLIFAWFEKFAKSKKSQVREATTLRKREKPSSFL